MTALQALTRVNQIIHKFKLLKEELDIKET